MRLFLGMLVDAATAMPVGGKAGAPVPIRWRSTAVARRAGRRALPFGIALHETGRPDAGRTAAPALRSGGAPGWAR